jgi:hypothetical protein
MKICPKPTPTQVLNWRYRLADSTTINMVESLTRSSMIVMNWRYRQTDLNYEILTKVKSTSEVNWRYQIPAISAADLN